MEELRRLRKERGLTQRGLAEASGVDPATISLVENGKRRPHLETLDSLAMALGVEVTDLIPKAEPSLFDTGGQRRDRQGVEPVSRVRAELLEKLADLWSLQLDRGYYDRETLFAMDWVRVVLGLNHAQEEDFLKAFLPSEAEERLVRAEERFAEHELKLKGVLEHFFGQGQVVEMQQYLADRDAKREEVRRVISGTA
jgi:transcriptional regulator with XRE-family HTH domain